MDNERRQAFVEATLRANASINEELAQVQAQVRPEIQVEPPSIWDMSTSITPQWVTSTSSSYGNVVFDPSVYYGAQGVSSATLLRRRKKEEKEHVANFVATGVPAWLGAILRQDGFLQLSSEYRLHDCRVMFLLNEQRLVYWPKRSKHLLPLLTELAEREGLDLVESESIILKREGSLVAFWKFKHQKEVDDTELVMATKPKVSAMEDSEPDSEPLGYDVWRV